MKYVLLAIFVLLAAQPLQAAPCDMVDGQGTDHSQHGNMRDGPMEHDNGQDMGCCDHDPADSGDGCNSMSHCGACVTGLAAVNPSMLSMTFGSNPLQCLAVADGILSRSGSPPFRPPIA